MGKRGPKTKYPLITIRRGESDVTLAKKCSSCEAYRSIDEFHKNPDGAHGLYSKCKYCYSEQRNAQYIRYNTRRLRQKGEIQR